MHDDTSHADNPRMRPEPTGFYDRATWEAECRVEVARDMVRAAAESYQRTGSEDDYITLYRASALLVSMQSALLDAR
jgi:hypothetical protein